MIIKDVLFIDISTGFAGSPAPLIQHAAAVVDSALVVDLVLAVVDLTAAEQRQNNSKDFKDFDLNVKAII